MEVTPEYLGELQALLYVRWNPGSGHQIGNINIMVKHGGGSNMLWEWCAEAWKGKLQNWTSTETQVSNAYPET